MKAKPINITLKLVDDIRLYLTGGMKMIDVRKKHKLTHIQVTKVVDNLLKEKTLFTDKDRMKIEKGSTPPKRKRKKHIPVGGVPSFRTQHFHKYSNEQIADIIQKQLAFEKQIRVTEEVSQKITVPQDWYLKSKLVNKQRIL